MNVKAKVLSIAVLSVLLAACKSTPIEPAKVEDKSPSTSTATAPTDTGADANAIKEVTIDSSANSDANNPLKDPNNILSKRQIYFDYNSDAIKPEFQSLIAAHAKYLQANATAKMTIQGNTDERGTREYNLSLGQRRSVSVKKALNVLGVKDDQIETVSYGEERATPNCANEDCFSKNRRADIVYGSD
jgi:peptidoglycan-associated lipoprotein